jgi:multidrug efflux pump subunit AcrA (membrane-fusion protein)
MKSFYTLLIISLIGLVIGVTNIYKNSKTVEGQSNPIKEMKLPFKSFIAGTGIVESSSKEMIIGSMVSGIVKKVFVQSGDKIKTGELLFELDDRVVKNKINILKAEINLAKKRVIKAKHQFDIVQDFKKVSTQMVTNKNFNEKKDTLAQNKALLNLAYIKLETLKKEFELYKVYSPIDGVILDSKLTKGVYFNANSKLLKIGSDKLNIRVSINEYNLFRFESNRDALAYPRGDNKMRIKLKYLYTIPLVVPKKNLTGIGTEQTDTRVLQVIYQIPHAKKFPIYVGEQLNVFVKAKESR